MTETTTGMVLVPIDLMSDLYHWFNTKWCERNRAVARVELETELQMREKIWAATRLLYAGDPPAARPAPPSEDEGEAVADARESNAIARRAEVFERQYRQACSDHATVKAERDAAEAALAERDADIARAVEALDGMLELRDRSLRQEVHPEGEMNVVARARSTLAALRSRNSTDGGAK